MRKITLVSAQYPVTYHQDFAAWRAHVRSWVQLAAAQNAQLLLFPEYGSMELVSLLPTDIQLDIKKQVQEMDRLRDDFCIVFADLARECKLVIVAPSFPVSLEDRVINRCYVFGPGGTTGYQDKYFMTRFELEEWDVVSSFPRLCVFEADWGRFGIQICYDVEFPVGAALLAEAGMEILLAPSCTETVRGSTRVHVGARARALEQQCYVVVSPLVGAASWSPAVDVNYGFAGFYSTPDRFFPEEGILNQGMPNDPGLFGHVLDLELIEKVRREGQTLNYLSGQEILSAFKTISYKIDKTFI